MRGGRDCHSVISKKKKEKDNNHHYKGVSTTYTSVTHLNRGSKITMKEMKEKKKKKKKNK